MAWAGLSGLLARLDLRTAGTWQGVQPFPGQRFDALAYVIGRAVRLADQRSDSVEAAVGEVAVFGRQGREVGSRGSVAASPSVESRTCRPCRMEVQPVLADRPAQLRLTEGAEAAMVEPDGGQVAVGGAAFDLEIAGLGAIFLDEAKASAGPKDGMPHDGKCDTRVSSPMGTPSRSTKRACSHTIRRMLLVHRVQAAGVRMIADVGDSVLRFED